MSLKLAGQLFTQRRFLPLFTLLQTGTFNDNGLKNALIFLITFAGVIFLPDRPSAIRVPLAALIFTGPFLLVCAIAGQIADKYDRGLILKQVKRAEVLIMILAAIGFWFVNVWILCLALFFMGAQSAFFSPTKNAVLPQWLNDKELITGNALLNGFVFVFVLVGMLAGYMITGLPHGTKIIAGVLLFFALIGWYAGESLPKAPPPKPELKINFEPLTATIQVLRQGINSPEVFRPLLGVAWFYGLSTVIVTTLPDYVKAVMGYDQFVLIALLVVSTVGILLGSLCCILLERLNIWGQEAIGLSALGIIGIVIFSADLYLFAPDVSVALSDGSLKGLNDFLGKGANKRMMVDVFMASMFGGFFVVPLQAMSQRRANPAIRARLMSAGAVSLNLAVNLVTFLLLWMAREELPPKSPFLIIISISVIVAIYAVWRTFHPTQYQSYAKEG